MRLYVVARLGQAALTLLILSLVVFVGVNITGDPVLILVGESATQEEYEQVKHNLGLDRALHEQYLSFLARVAEGDLGKSSLSGRPVRDMILQRLPYTLQLAGAAWVLEIVGGVLLGVVTATRRGSWTDRLGKTLALLGMAVPNFWLGIMLIVLFGATLRWLPTYSSGGIEHLVLPAFVLGAAGMAGMMRLVRSSLLEVLDSEFIKFARAKGLQERLVVYKHALKNAFIPALTFGGLSLAALLNGSVAVEVVFAWPGMGRLMYQGIGARDVAVVQATVLTAGLFYVALSFAVDLLYGFVDPRIRHRVTAAHA